MTNGYKYPLVWFWRRRLPERKGEPCRVLTRARAMGSILVEFPDGHKVITGRHAVRRPQGKWSKRTPNYWSFRCCNMDGGGLGDWPHNDCADCGRRWYRPPRRKNNEPRKKKH
jgi:hypothetical protein